MFFFVFFSANFGLTGTGLPNAILSLTGLTSLDLADNSLEGSIYTFIGELTKLESLILDNNAFIGSVPEEIDSLTMLDRLSISGNQLAGVLPVCDNESKPSIIIADCKEVDCGDGCCTCCPDEGETCFG